MVLSLFIFIPLLAGVALFGVQRSGVAKSLALSTSLAVLALTVYTIGISSGKADPSYSASWIPSINSSFSLWLDGAAKICTLLTAVSFVLILLGTWNNVYDHANRYYALLMLSMSGLMGVFLSADALLFYFFWELALIPVYFLCSIWGGEKRIAVTFKFFIYTFLGSVLMLIGIIYLYHKSPGHSFDWTAIKAAVLNPKEQAFFFWFFFLAFAVKMPLFPFHTWQPDTYDTAPTGTTMVLSGVMVKMGLFGVIRWLLPLFPGMAQKMATPVIILAITGILYASLIAIRQSNIKRLIAFSSIAHIGLMCAALFTRHPMAYQGVLFQMFSHGINIIGLWMVVDLIEQQTGIREMNQLGGLANAAPSLTVMLVVVAMANIALPLTNGFVGEFLMFNGLFQFNPWMAAVAGISIILAAVYTLGMIQQVFLGKPNPGVQVADLNPGQWVALVITVVLIFAAGVYPGPMLEWATQTARSVATVIK